MGDRTLAYLQGYHSVVPLSQRHDSWRQDFRVSPTHDVEVDCRGNFLTLYFNKPPGDELLRALNDLYDKVSLHARRLKPESQILTDGTLLRTAWQTEPQFEPGESKFMIGVMPTYSPGQVAEAIASELEGRYKMRVKRSQSSKPKLGSYDSVPVKKFRMDAKGDGVPCGGGWIRSAYKCSKGKAKATPKDRLKRVTAKRRGEQAASKAATLEQDFKIANMTQAEFVGGAKNKKTVQKLKETHRQATLNSLQAGRVPKGNKFAQYDYPDISKRFAEGEFDRKPRKNS